VKPVLLYFVLLTDFSRLFLEYYLKWELGIISQGSIFQKEGKQVLFQQLYF